MYLRLMRLFLFLSMIGIFLPPSYGGTFNFTLLEGNTTGREPYLRPTASVNDTVGVVSRLKDDIFILDSLSGLERAELSIKPRSDVTRYGENTISIKEYTELGHVLPPEIESAEAPVGDISLEVFVVIEVPMEGVEWAQLKVKYKMEDFPADIAEESVHLVRYDQEADRWVRLRDAPNWAPATGVDVENKYAWANITRVGVFGLMGGGMAVDDGALRIPDEVYGFKLQYIIFGTLSIVLLYAFIKARRK